MDNIELRANDILCMKFRIKKIAKYE